MRLLDTKPLILLWSVSHSNSTLECIQRDLKLGRQPYLPVQAGPRARLAVRCRRIPNTTHSLIHFNEIADSYSWRTRVLRRALKQNLDQKSLSEIARMYVDSLLGECV